MEATDEDLIAQAVKVTFPEIKALRNTGKTTVKSDMSDSVWLNVITQCCTVSRLIGIELAILPLDFGLATCAILHI